MILNGEGLKHQFLELPLALPFVWPQLLSKEWLRMEVSAIQQGHVIKLRRLSCWVHGLPLLTRKLAGLLLTVLRFIKYTIQRYTRWMQTYSKESNNQVSKPLLWPLTLSSWVKDLMTPDINSPCHIHIKWKTSQNILIKGQNQILKEKKDQDWQNLLKRIKIMKLVGMSFHLWRNNQDFQYLLKESCVQKMQD